MASAVLDVGQTGSAQLSAEGIDNPPPCLYLSGAHLAVVDLGFLSRFTLQSRHSSHRRRSQPTVTYKSLEALIACFPVQLVAATDDLPGRLCLHRIPVLFLVATDERPYLRLPRLQGSMRWLWLSVFAEQAAKQDQGLLVAQTVRQHYLLDARHVLVDGLPVQAQRRRNASFRVPGS